MKLLCELASGRMLLDNDSGVTAPANFSAELSGGMPCSSALVLLETGS